VRDRLGYLTRQYKVLSGVELIALGVRDCARGDRVMVAAKKPPAPPPARRLPDSLSESLARNRSERAGGGGERPGPARGRPGRVDHHRDHDRNPVLRARAARRRRRGSRRRSPNSSAAAAASGHELHVAEASFAQSSRLIAGAQPILDASRFAPAVYSPRADVEPSKDEKFGVRRRAGANRTRGRVQQRSPPIANLF